MLKSIAFAAVASFALVGCSSPDTELNGDIDVGGMDPANWTVEVRKATGKSIISILGEPSFEGGLPVKSNGANGAILMTSTTPKGEFVMNFTRAECFDGLAEEARPWTVTVNWNGETLNGCAFALPAAAT
jgi:uncharacterized membrane protein